MRALARGSRGLLWLLAAVVVPPAATLAWLGFTLLRQDRTLLAQQIAEAQQRADEVAAMVLERQLADVEALPPGPLGAGLVRLTLDDALRADPAGALAWWPELPALPEAPDTPFADAERLEFRGEPARALVTYLALTQSTDAATQAGAWLRVARVHRATHRWDDALAAYDRLASVDDVGVAGVAASLQARRAAVVTLGEAGRTDVRRQKAAELARALEEGRWRLDKDTWDRAWAELVAAGIAEPARGDRELVSLAADALWRERSGGPVRRAALALDSRVATVVPWRGDVRTAIVVLPSTLERWRDAARREARVASLELLVPHRDGLVAETGRASMVNATSFLPWTLAVGPADQTTIIRQMTNRRRLLVAGLVAMLVLLAGGSYFLWRVVDRELAVARLKADFVAAVSHEFRTPLTSLRHIAELLDENDEMPAASRREFYRALGRNTDRLHRLVESLLDFARLDAGRRPYDLQRLDTAIWAAGVVDEFRREQAPAGVAVELEVRERPGAVMADSAALGNALWNLLDNAVKYSPSQAPIRVLVAPHDAGVAIAVEDSGLGIARDERDEIFERFARGRRAHELGITGTGLGLALVRHIVAAHGGTVELESEEGAGSTFRIVLPEAG
jgi:two-component system phosphate regulon sensor histidine kinase PhoR